MEIWRTVGGGLSPDCFEAFPWDRGVKPLLQLEINTPPFQHSILPFDHDYDYPWFISLNS